MQRIQTPKTTNLADRLKTVNERICAACERAGRRPDSVKTIVVTKTAQLESVKEAIRLGSIDLGENRVQHLKQVASEIDNFLTEQPASATAVRKVNWHMIGHLQRNKVRQVLPLIAMIHSVDTLRLAEEINTAAKKIDIKANILLQVNCSGEPQKYGSPVGAAIHLAEQFSTMNNIRLSGLMTMAPLTRDDEQIRRAFIRARELFEEIKAESFAGSDFRHLSMGMSQDYEIAIEEGATLLRIGSAFFA
jgi:PLP dependent protein